MGCHGFSALVAKSSSNLDPFDAISGQLGRYSSNLVELSGRFVGSSDAMRNLCKIITRKYKDLECRNKTWSLNDAGLIVLFCGFGK